MKITLHALKQRIRRSLKKEGLSLMITKDAIPKYYTIDADNIAEEIVSLEEWAKSNKIIPANCEVA